VSCRNSGPPIEATISSKPTTWMDMQSMSLLSGSSGEPELSLYTVPSKSVTYDTSM